MQTRPIPSSGEALPVIGCGTYVGFDVGADTGKLKTLAAVVRTLRNAGGKVFDSSPMYGRAEAVLGDLLAAAPDPERTFIATKVWTRGRQAGITQMERSFALLRSKRIDLMQVHNLLDWQTHLRTLRSWKQDGRIRYLGVTHYTSSAYDELEAVMRKETLDFVQLNYSLDDRAAERKLLPLAAERGIAILVNVPFGDRLHQLGTDPAEVRPRPSGRDLRDPRDGKPGAYGGQLRGRNWHAVGCGFAQAHHRRMGNRQLADWESQRQRRTRGVAEGIENRAVAACRLTESERTDGGAFVRLIAERNRRSRQLASRT